MAGDVDGLRNLPQVAFEDRDVGRLTRDVRSAAHCDADVGPREGRRVVDAVAHDGDGRAPLLEGLHEVRLLLRERVGDIAGDAERIGRRLRDRRMVAGEHDDVPHAALAQRPDDAGSLGPDRVGAHQDPDQLAVLGDEHGGCGRVVDAEEIRPRPPHVDVLHGHETVGADQHGPPLHQGLHAEPDRVLGRLALGNGKLPGLGGAKDRLRELVATFA